MSGYRKLKQKQHGIHRIPERYIAGDVTLKELLTFLESMQPVEHRLSIGDYMILCDWVEKLASALDIDEEEQP
jgi:hypothetical protein